MALKKLLTNLEQGLTAYPNHNTPSDVGGFNYSNSTSIFDTKEFNQKSLRFGQGTAFDRPGGGFSNQPFQTNNITRELGFLLDNYGLLQKIPQGIDTVTDGFIRGGVLTHAKRLIQDTERIGRFLLTPKGLSFITKQVGLQKSNPKIDEPGAGFLNISNANQRTYNLGINTLASVASAGTGIRIKREGLLPTANKGYADSDSLFEDNDKNRLWNLFEQHIEGGSNTSNLYSYSGGPDSLYGIGRTTIRKYKGDKGGDIRYVSQNLLNRDVPEDGFLYNVKALRGNYDKSGGYFNITIPDEKGHLHLFDDSDAREEGGGGNIPPFDVTSHLDFDKGENGKKRHGYIPKVGDLDLWSTEKLMIDLVPPTNYSQNLQFSHIQPGKEGDTAARLAEPFLNGYIGSKFRISQLTGRGLNGPWWHDSQLGMRLDKTLIQISNYPEDKDEGPNNIPYSKHFVNPNSHLKNARPHTLFEPVTTSTTKAINFLVTTKGYGTNYQLEAYKAKNKQTYHREERVNIGNPGAKSSRDGTRDPYLIQTKGKGKYKTSDYSIFNSSRIDKINAMDVFESEGDFDVHAVRDFIRFRFEMINNDTGKSDTILFRALLDNIDDNYAASHNTFKYNGRGEEFYTYNSFKRNINFNFKIAATTRHEMMPLYRKLNFLVSNTAPDYGATGRMRTPFTRLTIGAWCDRIPGVINSVNLKWQKDYPWDISISSPEGGVDLDKSMNVLPHVLDVSVQFTPVHNFLPEKSIHSPFILPHTINRKALRPGQRWTVPEIPANLEKAAIDNFEDGTNRKLGIKLKEFVDIPRDPTPNNERTTASTETSTETSDPTEEININQKLEELKESDIVSADAVTGEGSVILGEYPINPIQASPIDNVVEATPTFATTATATTTTTPLIRVPTSIDYRLRSKPAQTSLSDGGKTGRGKRTEEEKERTLRFGTQFGKGAVQPSGDYIARVAYYDQFGNEFVGEGRVPIGHSDRSNAAKRNAEDNATKQFREFYKENPQFDITKQ